MEERIVSFSDIEKDEHPDKSFVHKDEQKGKYYSPPRFILRRAWKFY